MSACFQLRPSPKHTVAAALFYNWAMNCYCTPSVQCLVARSMHPGHGRVHLVLSSAWGQMRCYFFQTGNRLFLACFSFLLQPCHCVRAFRSRLETVGRNQRGGQEEPLKCSLRTISALNMCVVRIWKLPIADLLPPLLWPPSKASSCTALGWNMSLT